MKKNPPKDAKAVKSLGKLKFFTFIALFMISMFPLSAHSIAQREAKISLSLKNVNLETALKRISQITDVKFVYNNTRINKTDKLSVEVSNQELDKVLAKILGTNFSWQYVDNYVVISARPQVSAPAPRIQSELTVPADQTIEVKGKVISKSGEPLIGVSVVVKGTTTGVATDVNGSFSLKVAPKSILVFSYIGYINKEMPATAQMQVTLEEDQQQLDEVMVVAYGTAKKSSFTGSASVIKKDVLEKTQVSNISKALQGASTGVEAYSSSGQPGTDATIRIRGVGSYNASSSPLYVVDGVPFDGNLNSINPSDIESMTILKDAASSALYGSRGANGVIVITTKQGSKEASPTVEFKASYGFSKRAVKDYEQLTTNEYFELYWEALRNDYTTATDGDGNLLYTNEQAIQKAREDVVRNLGINPYGPDYPYPVGDNGKIVTGAKALWDDDWVDAASQDAHRTELQLSIAGGTKNTKYFISAGYLDDQGIIITSGFKRYTGRVNLTSDIKKWLTVGANLSVTHSLQDYPKSDDTAMSNVINTNRGMPSFYPVFKRDEYGNYIYENGKKAYDYGDYRPAGASPRYNLAGSMPYDKNQIKRDAASLRGFLEIKLPVGFNFKTSLNIDYNNINEHNYTNPLHGGDTSTKGSVSRSNNRTAGMTFNNILSYSQEYKDVHAVKALIGQEYYQYNTSGISGSRQGFPMLGFDEPDAASVLNDFGGSSDVYKLLSYFANFEYSYLQRYYLSASVRSDGSSRFDPATRWGTFWSVGASWKASEEEFIKQKEWISNLTFRASYGAQGNDNLGTYHAYQAIYTIANNLGENGIRVYQMANPTLKWETNLNLNLGVDLGLFEHRLNATVEFFDRRSKDLLFDMPMAPSTGFSSIDKNIGALKNVGWEFTLRGMPIRTDNWQWELSVNATTYKNKITKMPQDEIISGTKRLVKGGSIYDFFIPEWGGIDPETGDPMWWKTNAEGLRELTKDYDEANKTESKINAGSALSDVSGGFSTRIAFKGLELSALFSWQIGGKIYNQDKLSLLHNGSNAGHSWSKEMLNRWTPENRYTDVPRLTTTSLQWTSQSTRFLYDATYLRMKNLTVSYNLPKNWLQKIYIQNCQLFFTGENLWTCFKEQGLDPEQAIGGVTYFRYPAMRTFSFGINLKL